MAHSLYRVSLILLAHVVFLFGITVADDRWFNFVTVGNLKSFSDIGQELSMRL